MTAELSPDFYLAACDEATRPFKWYQSIIFDRYYAYMMGNEL